MLLPSVVRVKLREHVGSRTRFAICMSLIGSGHVLGEARNHLGKEKAGLISSRAFTVDTTVHARQCFVARSDAERDESFN